jgi:DNA-directed RNA polymerase specialized sigma24 family protein
VLQWVGLGALLKSAIDALPNAYRVLFMLGEVEGLSTGECAECLGLSEPIAPAPFES